MHVIHVFLPPIYLRSAMADLGVENDMDIVRLRFEAQQCYLRAVRSTDAVEIARHLALGNRLTALADQAEGLTAR